MTAPVCPQLPELWPCAFRRGFLSLLSPTDQATCWKFGNLLFASLLASEALDLEAAAAGQWVGEELQAVALDLRQARGQLGNLLEALQGFEGGREGVYRDLVKEVLPELDRLIQKLEEGLGRVEEEPGETGTERRALRSVPPRSIRPGAATPGRKELPPKTE